MNVSDFETLGVPMEANRKWRKGKAESIPCHEVKSHAGV